MATAKTANTPSPAVVYESNPLNLIKPSWAALKVNFWSLVVTGLIFIGVVVTALGAALASLAVIAPDITIVNPNDALPSSPHWPAVIGLGLVVLALLVLAAYFLAPVYTILLLDGAKGQKTSFGGAFKRGRKFAWRILAAGFLIALPILTVVLLGALLAILAFSFAYTANNGLAFASGLVLVPVIIAAGIVQFLFTVWFAFAPFVVVGQDLGAKASLIKSKELVKGHFVEVFATTLLSTAVGIVAAIPVIGWVIAIAASIVLIPVMAVRYLQLLALKASASAAPKVHWANYLVIVLALVSGTVDKVNQNNYVPTDLKPGDYQTDYSM